MRAAMEGATVNCTPEQVEEILLQAYLFLGFPTALTGLALWREVSGRAPPQDVGEGADEWARRGEEICRRVYGARYGDLRGNIAKLHPEMDRWMILEGYGKVLGREGVALLVRELSIVGLLAVHDAPVQLYSHLRGALAVGATPAEVEEALESVRDLASPEVGRRAWASWVRVRDRT